MTDSTAVTPLFTITVPRSAYESMLAELTSLRFEVVDLRYRVKQAQAALDGEEAHRLDGEKAFYDAQKERE